MNRTELQDQLIQQMLDDSKNPIDEPHYPTDSAGNRFDHILFAFIGSVNNDQEVDPAPMSASRVWAAFTASSTELEK